MHGLETVVPELGEHGLFYRIATNGRQIVTSIYKNQNLLLDCDISKDQAEIDRFFLRFVGGASPDVFLPATTNVTVREIHSIQDLELAYRPIIEFSNLKVECRDLHRYLRREMKERAKKQEQDQEEENEVNANESLFPLYHKNAIHPLGDEDINDMIAKALESQHASRQKRAMLIYPGTNW